MIVKIISGGQTGADIAGVDAALYLGLSYGGTIPKDRRSENGQVPLSYTRFVESCEWAYPVRTEQNIVNSDATVIFIEGVLAGGSKLTVNLAVRHKKPYLVLNMAESGGFFNDDNAVLFATFLKEHNISILNVAGSRESKYPGIYQKVFQFLINQLR